MNCSFLFVVIQKMIYSQFFALMLMLVKLQRTVNKVHKNISVVYQ